MPPPLLALKGATLRLARQLLFDAIDVGVGRGDRICLVGRNGSGKSTLLRVLAGLQELDAGERFVQPRTAIAYLPQEPAFEPDVALADEVLAGLPAGERLAAARYRAEIVIEQLQLDPEARTGTLSGGETRRLAIAKTLVGEPDILLLDEPTNHLDVATIEWLEGELQAFAGGLVVISHDRMFLTRLSRTTWWLDRGRLREAPHGFAGFEAWSEQVLAAEEAELQRIDKRIQSELLWVHKGVTARRKRNMGRLRNLAVLREERRNRLLPTGSVRLEAERGRTGGRLVIEAEGIAKRFGERTIVERFGTRILRGDRVGIIGPNGAGKTTLLRLLTGELAPDAGTVRLGTHLEIARYDQNRARLDPERSPWATLCPDGGDQVVVRGRPQHVAGYLRDFLFRDEQLRTPVKALSGGERNRLLLALILAAPSNLLILDEPTNDLDMDTLDLLEEALADYEGTLLLVSHDRDFLDRLVTSTIAFEAPG
ncbi:MAG TPA: ABC-F family ATP-binding cassette domain-containing protein, partial [Geminicoccaceae bacterium]|nr:ABC-F family ATP-binding cassette domain-containing protein [Geminicoccaceae bacterium]